MNHIRGLLAGLADDFDLVAQGAVGRQLQQQQFGIGDQAAEQIVQIVGHPRRQTADRLHLFGLLELLFQFFAAVNVPGDALGADEP